MTAAIAAGAPLDPIRWNAIHWPTIHDQVRRLQVRIAKAAGEGNEPPSNIRVAVAAFV